MSARILRTAIRPLVLVAASAILGGLAAAPALANVTINVNTPNDDLTPGDGTCSLREAIAFANGITEFDCATVPTPSGTTTIKLPANSSHYFLGAMGELALTGVFGPVVIEGTGVGPLGTTIDAAHNDRVLLVEQGANVSITGLTITGGIPRPSGCPAGGPGCPGTAGGGVANEGVLTLTNVAVTGNTAGNGGTGAIGPGGCAEPGGAGGGGGGIANAGTLTMTGVTVSGNAAGAGGAYPSAGSCFFQAGGAGGAGGGILNLGTLKAFSSTISNNSAGAGGSGYLACGFFGGAGGAGGGIDNTGTLSLDSSTVSGNRAGSARSVASGGDGAVGGAGGGIASTAGSLTVSASTISGDTAGAGGSANSGCGVLPGSGGAGGGIDSTAALTMLNSTIASNTSGAGATGCTPSHGCYGGASGGAGGGIAHASGNATLTNLTIAGNSSGSGGTGASNGSAGAGSQLDVASGLLYEANTIIQGGCAGKINDAGGNLQSAGSGCQGAVGNAELGALQGNGGPTQTMAPGSGSAAIDQIPANPASCPATDQRGFIRPDGESICDAGAFETGARPFILCIRCVAGLTLAPHFFGLTLHGTKTRGATVISVLHKPRVLVLLVRRIVRHHRLTLVGLVRLGQHRAGRSTAHWNLRVGGRLLAPGSYQIVMYALDNGNVLSLPARPGARTLVVFVNGEVRTRR